MQTNDRMWRKTRSPNTGGCFGTDANRFYPLPPSPGTAEQAEALQVLQQEVGLDFWLEPIQGRAVDIRVAPEQVDSIFQLNK